MKIPAYPASEGELLLNRLDFNEVRITLDISHGNFCEYRALVQYHYLPSRRVLLLLW